MSRLRALVLLCAAAVPTWALAQEVLVEGEGVTITTTDVMAELQRVPPDARKSALSRPEAISQLAANLYQRRVLAAQAERTKLDADPLAQANLRIARDRILSDLQLAQIDKASPPDEAALDALAQNAYRANHEKFRTQEQIRVSHILMGGDDKTAARTKAEQLLAQLKSGADFAELARQNSTDTGSAARGGDLGFIRRGRMVPAFETAAFALKKPGELSGVVETQFGYHILRLEEIQPGTAPAFPEVKEQLRKELSASFIKAGREREIQRIMNAARVNDAAMQALANAQR